MPEGMEVVTVEYKINFLSSFQGGELRATGDVLIDQLVQMQRTGFDVAVLKDGVDASAAQRQFERFNGFYQGSAVETQPAFAKATA